MTDKKKYRKCRSRHCGVEFIPTNNEYTCWLCREAKAERLGGYTHRDRVETALLLNASLDSDETKEVAVTN